MKNRIVQLDYLKGVFILLMVTFHIQLIEENYPLLRSAIYTFHMPAFLIISGYLSNVEKTWKDFLRGLARLTVPYVLFELIYIVMHFYLGKAMHSTNASIDSLNAISIISTITAYPVGPYWYIHTLIICTIVYYFIYRVFKFKSMTAIVVTGSILYGLSLVLGGFSWGNVIYFLIGVCLFRSGKSFTESVPPSYWALIPLCILFASSDNYNRMSLAGVAITLLIISLLLSLYTHCGNKATRFFNYLGCNSLSIVVFSPIFTATTKIAVPLFKFDPTHICFAIFAVCFTVVCCLLCAFISDKLHISKYIFCKEKIYFKY